MKLLSLSKKISFFVFFYLLCGVLYGENEIDIWKNDDKKNIIIESKKEIDSPKNKSAIENKDLQVTSLIEENILNQFNDKKIYGIYDPEKNNFNLNMWSNTDGKEIEKTINRINKLELSSTAKNFFLSTILTYSYPPQNINDDDFLNLKLKWLISKNETSLLEEYLNKNQNFKNKTKVIQYLVDRNIAGANLKKGCEKVNFINKEIKDKYLEKFKIYCLIFNNKNSQAQLLFDILKEQNQSDNFFNDKINFLLGFSETTTTKVNEKNLLNFYLSSITIPNFKYEPNKNTKKIIWEYLNSANLIQIENITDLKKIKDLEIAANSGTLNKIRIFEIYEKIPFDLNTLINAENTYQSLNIINSRALIYQKFLLSDNIENKIKLLFLLKDLFKKDKLENLYVEFLSDRLKEIKKSEIPDSFVETVERNIIEKNTYKLGRIKYDDKILHKSRALRFYTEKGTLNQKTQKDLDNVYKKIKRNKKYFFSAKDLALVESLKADGFKIPKEINYKKVAEKYDIPISLSKLVQNNETGFLALKIVEIIGEDEVANLDPETIYFLIHLLNKLKLLNFRNEIIISGLPLRL